MIKSECFVILPARNEAKTIGKIIKEIKLLGYDNVIVVDDGSDDITSHIARRAGAIVLRHIINRGQGAAVKTGMEYAKRQGASRALIMDSDGQFLAEDIELLQKKMNKTNADIVFGSRFLRENPIPLIKRFYNTIANVVSYLLSGIWLSDSQTGFRLIGPRALYALDLQTDGYEFCTEMIRLAGYYRLTTAEVPVRVLYFKDNRRRGQSFATGIETFFNLMVESYFR